MKTVHTFAAAFALTSALSGAAFAATKVGVIGAANPQVFVSRDGGDQRELKVGDEIFLNDKLSTNGKGSAQLMFLDKSALTISPDSAVTIDEFVYDPGAKDGTMTVNGAKGAFRFIGGALTKKKAVNIKTPVSTIGIRGGIVDTHIAASGQTDALFLFGKELTMTNGAGVTTSTSEFGSGLGLSDAFSAPASLPQAVVSAHISNSPTQAAVRVAPPSSAAQINAIEAKVDTGASSKVADNPGSPASSNAPASSGGNGSQGGSGDNGGNDAGGDGPANQDGASNQNDGASNNSGSSSAPGDAPTRASADGPPAAPANAPANGPAAAPAVAGLAEGAGLKPIDAPVADIQVNTAELGSQDLYAKVDQFVNEGGDGDGDGQLDFAINREQAARIETTRESEGTARQGRDLFRESFGEALNDEAPRERAEEPPFENANAPDPAENAEPDPLDSADMEDPSPSPPTSNHNQRPIGTLHGTIASGDEINALPLDGRVITASELSDFVDPEGHGVNLVPGSFTISGANRAWLKPNGDGTFTLFADAAPSSSSQTITVQYEVTDGANIVHVTRDIVVSSATDLFGNSTKDWDTTAPTLAQPKQFVGQLYHNNGVLDVSKTEGYEETLSGALNEGYHVFVASRSRESTTDDYTGMSNVTPGIAEDYIIGRLNPLTAGMNILTKADVAFEDNIGRVIHQKNFSGKGWQTPDGTFNYYQMQWDDLNGTPTDISDDTQAYTRGYFVRSPLVATYDAATYDAMLAEASDFGLSQSSAAHSIVEYDFLPDLAAIDPALFGQIDYNQKAGFGGGLNSTGLLVDWNNKRFLGGNVSFASSAPAMQLLFGEVQGGTSAIGTGSAFNGSFYELEQDSFANTANYGLNVRVGTKSIASSGLADAAIEGFVVETNLGPNPEDVVSEQAAVLGAGGSTLTLNEAPVGVSQYGFTAGLVSDATTTSRIANDETSKLNVNQSTGGALQVNLSYKEKDSVGSFVAGDEQSVHFGNGANDAALQKNLYAAEVWNGGSSNTSHTNTADISLTEGAIISMHEATSSEAGLVCSSCDFAHWGVWQVDHIDTTNSVEAEKTAFVPYVAGDITSDAELTAAAGIVSSPTQVRYSGDIAANTLTGGSIHNQTGSFEALIDLQGRSIKAYGGAVGGMQFGFNGDAAAHTLNGVNIANGTGEASPVTFNASTASFGNVNLVDIGGSPALTGTLNGTLYGNEAQEIGGNFYVEETGSGNKAAGIYLGER